MVSEWVTVGVSKPALSRKNMKSAEENPQVVRDCLDTELSSTGSHSYKRKCHSCSDSHVRSAWKMVVDRRFIAPRG